jgi:hypothetical protein
MHTRSGIARPLSCRDAVDAKPADAPTRDS